jgi:transposase
MVRTNRWGPRGQRLRGQAPHGHWQTLTFLAALRHDRIDPPCVLDGPINSESFKAYIEQFLVPTLKPGDIVIMDNLGSHKGHAVRRAIRSVDARLLFLPSYSSDLKSIGQVFAKLKTLLRKCHRANCQPGSASEPCSIPSHHRTAPTTFETQDMLPPKWKMRLACQWQMS